MGVADLLGVAHPRTMARFIGMGSSRMAAFLRRVGAWLTRHPHAMVSFSIGLLVGIGVTTPFGWELPGPAASLVGAVVGIGGAVGSALWAANAKQRQEEITADRSRKHVASMIAAAITPEIANARKLMTFVAERLDIAIKTADESGDSIGVRLLLEGGTVDSAMCERFLPQFSAFGDDAPGLIEAVGSMIDTTRSNLSTAALMVNNPWRDTRDLAVGRAKMMAFYGTALVAALELVRKSHFRGAEDGLWKLWTS